MGVPPGSYNTLADLVDAEQGIDTSPDFSLANPTQLVTFLSDGVQPPAAQYVTVNDVLQIFMLNSVAGAQITLAVRILKPDGTLNYTQTVFVPTSDRQGNKFQFQLAEGFLLSVVVASTAATTERGACFVQVRLQFGVALTRTAHVLLISDYLMQDGMVGWPNPLLRSCFDAQGLVTHASVANPAAGSDWSQTVPIRARWKLRSVRALLQADGNAANRAVTFSFGNGTNFTYKISSAFVQVAGQGIGYSFAPGLPVLGMNNNEIGLPLPAEVMLEPGDSFGVSTLNLDAGDQWSHINYSYEEWLIA